jgi:hypothetical protein
LWQQAGHGNSIRSHEHRKREGQLITGARAARAALQHGAAPGAIVVGPAGAIAMNEDSQIIIPPSFIALFVLPHRVKPSASRDEIAARYEICEDLASHLVEHAKDMHHGMGVSEDEVLVRCHRGLADGASGIAAPEAEWVVRRLAELLDWNCPEFPEISNGG